MLRSALAEAGYFAALVAGHLVAWLPVGLLVLQDDLEPFRVDALVLLEPRAAVADVGHVPAKATEWGTTLPFLADYRLFSDGTALLLAQGRQP